MDLFLIVAVLFAAALLLVMAVYNGLASLRQEVRDAWGLMDAELRRRYDLLPPLLLAARSTGEPNPSSLTAALTAKNQAAVAFNPQQLAEAEGALTRHLRDLFAEPPPHLAPLPAFAACRSDLTAAQSRIDQAGRRYNEAVGAYNLALQSFPQDIVAVAFGFKPQPPFELAGVRP